MRNKYDEVLYKHIVDTANLFYKLNVEEAKVAMEEVLMIAVDCYYPKETPVEDGHGAMVKGDK